MTWASLQRSTQPAVSRDRPTVSVGGGVVETAWAPGASSREDMSPDGHCCVCRYTSEQPLFHTSRTVDRAPEFSS